MSTLHAVSESFIDLRGLQQYEERLAEAKARCDVSGRSFAEFVQSGLMRTLGESAAKSTVIQLGTDTMSSPSVLVERLVLLFHRAAVIVLRELVAYWEGWSDGM